MLKKSILVIIPARAGSQRVKNKNLRLVNKRPLVIWSIDYAKKIEKIFQNTKIIVSTDSLKIKKISESSETNVIQRPKNISGNKASMHSVISHILGKIDKKNKFDFIILLQPTSPIRKISWIKKSFKILNENKKYENLIHLNRLNKYIGKLQKNLWKPEFSSNTRSQDIINQFEPSGCLFIYKRKNFENLKKFNKRLTYGFHSSELKTVNIDYEEDFVLLNYYLSQKSLKSIIN